SYGIVEEGVAVHTFVLTGGSPVNVLGQFGHSLGVNWVRAVGLTLFHTLYSIALPILLTHLYYPALRGRRFLPGRWLTLPFLAGALIVVLFAVSARAPVTPGLYVAFLGVAALLVGLARYAPAGWLEDRPVAARTTPPGLFLAGGLSYELWILHLIGGAPRIVPQPVVAALLPLGVAAAALTFVRARIGRPARDLDLDWLAVGALAPLLLWSVLLELFLPGILLATALAVYFLARLRGRLVSRISWVAAAHPDGAARGALP
ncbi:MAG: hypothetical protein ACREC5_05475, partial [Thermoplasmata archaeon]